MAAAQGYRIAWNALNLHRFAGLHKHINPAQSVFQQQAALLLLLLKTLRPLEGALCATSPSMAEATLTERWGEHTRCTHRQPVSRAVRRRCAEGRLQVELTVPHD